MNGISLLLFTTAICYLFLGIDTIKDEPREKTNLTFFIVCIGAFWWALSFAFLFSAADLEQAWRWLRLSYPGWIFLPGPTLHACLVLSQKERALGAWLYPLVYLPGLFFLYLALTRNITTVTYSSLYGYSGGTFRGNPLGYWSFSLYYLSYVTLGNILVFRFSRKTHRKGEKKKSRIIVISMSFSIILIYLVGTLLPGLEVSVIPRIPPLMALPWIVGMWFAITRYRFMELTPTIAAREILSSIQNLLLMVDQEEKILMVNHQSPTFLGYQQGDILNRSIQPFLEEEEVKEIRLALMQKNPQWEKETILKGRKKEIPVRMKVSTIKDREGDIIGALMVFQDLTNTHRLRKEAERRKEAEEELRRIHQELKTKDRQKTDFLSLISHELRTPLTSILGFARIISKKFDQSISPHLQNAEKTTYQAQRQFRSNVEIIISESERLTSLINDVLDITKMEAGRVDWKIETVNMKEIIQQAAAATASLFTEKNLSLIQDLEEDLPEMEGDRDRLIQVVINLLSNAVKFTREGKVTCQAQATRNSITIRIKDTGKGIPSEDLEDIFQKYHQVKGNSKEKYQGSGLGLPISREIIEYHRGQIWAESTPGEGSTFTFTLPVKKVLPGKGASVLTTVNSLLKQLSTGVFYQEEKRNRILVVDDDKNIRQLLKEELEGADFQVQEAVNGQEAMKKIEERRPHLIIMDIQMPALDGLHTLQLLKGDLSTVHIPVMILTVSEEREKALQLGAHTFMKKPLKIPLLLWTIQSILKKWRQPRVFLLHEEREIFEKLKGALEAKGFQVVSQEALPREEEGEEQMVLIMQERIHREKDLDGLKKKGRLLTILLEEE